MLSNCHQNLRRRNSSTISVHSRWKLIYDLELTTVERCVESFTHRRISRPRATRRSCMSEKLLKMGLIGAGRIGRLHAEHLTSRIASSELIIVAALFEES